MTLGSPEGASRPLVSTPSVAAPGESTTAERTEAVVIGGGVVGCAILRELAIRGIEAVLLEAEPDIGEGTSKANSAILHTGFDAKPGTIEAAMLRRSAELWPDLLDELGVPSLVCGALMLARSREEVLGLRQVADAAAGHGVATEILDGGALRDVAPYVTPRADAALSIPGEGVVDPFWLTRAFAEAAVGAGARVRTSARVVGLRIERDGVVVDVAGGGSVRADHVFLAAGVWSDEIAALAGDSTFALTPRKGQFLISEWTAGVDRIVLPIPGPLGKGMLVTPIVFGGILLGPTAEDGTDKTDRGTDDAGRRQILEATRALVPAVDDMDPIRRFAGVRAVSSTGDYVLRPSAAGDRLMIVAGIRSTGISASPAIAEEAVDRAAKARGWKRDRPRVSTVASGAPELSGDAGGVVCVCRSVAAAEVAAAFSGPLPAATTDGVKRRCGAGFGDCQGNRCLADVVARLADATGVDAASIEKAGPGSWIVASSGTGPVPHSPPAASFRSGPGDRPGSADVVVVGGGPAGIGAALAALDGLRVRSHLGPAGRVVVVERESRVGGSLTRIDRAFWSTDESEAIAELEAASASGAVVDVLTGRTVVGLDLDRRDGRWHLDLQGDDGAESIDAGAVVLATGGYVTPRDHLRIDGPRPAGVMTADFASDALDRGWLPTRRAVVVGTGRLATTIADRLDAAGAQVLERVGRELDGAPDQDPSERIREVRGERRVEAVRIDDRWVEADALILASSLRPAAFLLRGLGLGDDRPGVPMPVDRRGALAMPGLWAAGTCVAPDIDHGSSLAEGRAVGAAAVEGLTSAATADVAR